MIWRAITLAVLFLIALACGGIAWGACGVGMIFVQTTSVVEVIRRER